jgi:dihydrofolate reductase
VSAPVFTLAVVTSADGFIARTPDEPPQAWASAEEQAVFFADVEAADWAVMGRRTHAAADRPDRRRIVFSAAGGAGEWRRPTQLWIDPARLLPRDLAVRVAAVHPFRAGLILGGTRVHDWFLAHGAIDRIHLTVEPVRFGAGLPLFSNAAGPAADVLAACGFARRSSRPLNAAGTVHELWTPWA